MAVRKMLLAHFGSLQDMVETTSPKTQKMASWMQAKVEPMLTKLGFEFDSAASCVGPTMIYFKKSAVTPAQIKKVLVNLQKIVKHEFHDGYTTRGTPLVKTSERFDANGVQCMLVVTHWLAANKLSVYLRD